MTVNAKTAESSILADDVQWIDATDLTNHPISDILPMMQADELRRLQQSIADIGQREPVVLFQGTLLDGRNRAHACRRLGCRVKARQFIGTHAQAVEYVTDTNVQRRELSASQKACAAVDLIPFVSEDVQKRKAERVSAARQAQLKDEGGSRTGAGTSSAGKRDHWTAALCADILGVSPRYVDYAVQLKDANPLLFAEVKVGGKSLKAAIKELHNKTETRRARARRLRSRVDRMITAAAEEFPQVSAILQDALDLLQRLEAEAENNAEAEAEKTQFSIDPNPSPNVTW